MTRRSFLHHSAAVAGLSVAAPFQALVDRSHAGGLRANGVGYGPLAPVKDEATGLALLMLPAGFRYRSFGWAGDLLEGGAKTPGLHDGMAAFHVADGVTRIVRNHEIASTNATPFARTAYDPKAGGGTTTIEFDTRRGEVIKTWASISGTVRNCAGGPTPWGTWLTCEETVVGAGAGALTRPHGYVFEVPSDATAATAEPLIAMGRFTHEAVAVDPGTGIVYLTEDHGTAGFYRFTPKTRGKLADGGRLQMLGIAGRPKHDTRKGQTMGQTYACTWYDIDDPDRPHAPGTTNSLGVFTQGFERGAAIFARLEGAWWGNDLIYFVATSGGNAERGQVWAYSPSSERLALVFESPSASVLDMPDNVCVSPRGGLVLCEDGDGPDAIHGLTPDGQIFRFCENRVVLEGERNGLRGDFRNSEVAGVTYSPDGTWMFFNVQSPGISFAVTGPWGRGVL